MLPRILLAAVAGAIAVPGSAMAAALPAGHYVRTGADGQIEVRAYSTGTRIVLDDVTLTSRCRDARGRRTTTTAKPSLLLSARIRKDGTFSVFSRPPQHNRLDDRSWTRVTGRILDGGNRFTARVRSYGHLGRAGRQPSFVPETCRTDVRTGAALVLAQGGGWRGQTAQGLPVSIRVGRDDANPDVDRLTAGIVLVCENGTTVERQVTFSRVWVSLADREFTSNQADEDTVVFDGVPALDGRAQGLRMSGTLAPAVVGLGDEAGEEIVCRSAAVPFTGEWVPGSRR